MLIKEKQEKRYAVLWVWEEGKWRWAKLGIGAKELGYAVKSGIRVKHWPRSPAPQPLLIFMPPIIHVLYSLGRATFYISSVWLLVWCSYWSRSPSPANDYESRVFFWKITGASLNGKVAFPSNLLATLCSLWPWVPVNLWKIRRVRQTWFHFSMRIKMCLIKVTM